jgi:hypothetical protein
LEEESRGARHVRNGTLSEEGAGKMRTIRRRNWFIKRIALGLAMVAFATPVAQAKVDEGSSVQSNSYRPLVTDFPSYGNVDGTTGVSPSAAGAIKAHRFQVGNLAHDELVSRDGDHGSAANAHKPHRLGGALARGDSQAPWSLIAPLLGDQPSASGFDWGDAGIGAGFALVLAFLAGGAALATRHMGREQTA